MKQFPALVALVLAALVTPNAFAATVCDEIAQSKIEAIIGLAVAEKTAHKTPFSRACVYLTVPTESGPTIFSIERYTVPVKAEDVFGLMMTHEKTDVVPLAGLGDRAWLNTFQHEIAVMRGKETFKLTTLLCLPKPGPDETNEEAKARCLAIDQAAMTQVAQLLLASRK
jgi:hypothetical protein